MQARYYDPVIGRFYSNDPIGFRDIHSFNRYAYVNNNPYKYSDPSGMISECAKKCNKKSEDEHDKKAKKKNEKELKEVWVYYKGVPFRRHDRLLVDGKKLKFTEIKGASVGSTTRRHKRRLNRAKNYTISEKVSDVLGSIQQIKDVAMVNQMDLNDFTIPRLDNAKLSDFSDVTVGWELYDVNVKTGAITDFSSYDLSKPAYGLAIYDINN